MQLALYGRRVPTFPDRLLDWVRITDAAVIEKSGSDRHPILRRDPGHAPVEGAYLELDDAELAATDDYEVDDYVRVLVPLESGADAWAYLAQDDR